MELIQQTLSWPTWIDDPAILCNHLTDGAWLIEIGVQPPAAHNPEHLPPWSHLSGGAALSLTCATALRLSVGPALIEWVAQAGYPVGPLAALALHELIINAVVHGNLGVSNGHLDVWQDLSARQTMVTQALDDATRASRCVTIALGWATGRVLVVVADEGNGYAKTLPPTPGQAPGCATTGPVPARARSGRASGRGLRIVQAAGKVEVLQGGRQTILTLPCQPTEGDT